MKLSILLPDLRAGGVERIRITIARELVMRGHHVEFVLMKAQGDLMAEVANEFPVVDLQCSKIRYLPASLAKYIKKIQPDSLLVAMWPLTVVAPMMRIIGFRGRVVISEHCSLSSQYQDAGAIHRIVLHATMAIGYRLASARIGVSNGVVEDIARLSGLGRHSFHVIYNPVSPRVAPTRETLAAIHSLWPVGKGPRILTVGRMKQQKNHALLLRSFSALRMPNLSLMIVGTGNELGMLRNIATELGIENRVIFAGFQSDPTPFYLTADLFVLSSDYEGFGNVLVESLAQGTPVVSTDCPSGPREILTDGQFGRLVPVGDVQALAAAMAESLSVTHDPAALKARAQNFSIDKAVDQYEALLFPERAGGRVA